LEMSHDPLLRKVGKEAAPLNRFLARLAKPVVEGGQDKADSGSFELEVKRMPKIGDVIKVRSRAGWTNHYILEIDLSDSTGLPVFKTVGVPVYRDNPPRESTRYSLNPLRVHWPLPQRNSGFGNCVVILHG
jgi:hypothetical protein